MIRRRTVLKLIITVQQPYEKASIESFKSLCLIVEFAQVQFILYTRRFATFEMHFRYGHVYAV